MTDGSGFGLETILAKVTRSFEAAFRADSSLLYVPLVLLAALMIEAAWVGFRHSTLRRLMQIGPTDWSLYLMQQANLSILIGYAISLGVLYFLVGALHGIARWAFPIEVRITSAVGYFLAVDCLGYWYHRLLHSVPALWHLHHVHHSAPRFNVVNSFRSHPLEGTISRIFVALPATALFIPELSGLGVAVLIYLLATKLLNLLQHSQVTSNFGLAGKLFVSPAHHRVHHSTDPRHHNRNFGNSLIIWDKLFGTYAEVAPCEIGSLRIGLDDYRRATPVLRYLWETYGRFIGSLLPRFHRAGKRLTRNG